MRLRHIREFVERHPRGARWLYGSYQGIIVSLALAAVWLITLPEETEGVHEASLFIWLVLVVDYCGHLALASDRRRFARTHWIELIAILPLDFIFEEQTFGLARVLRLARFIRLIRAGVLLWRLSAPVAGVLKTNGLAYVLVFLVGLVLTGGVLIWAVEPEIETVWDGIWWSLVTSATVGYGDIAPKTAIGRSVAAVLIVAGLCTFSMLTSAITTYALIRPRAHNPHIRHVVSQLERWEDLTPEERRQLIAVLQVLAEPPKPD